jgi:hypothetical protein
MSEVVDVTQVALEEGDGSLIIDRFNAQPKKAQERALERLEPKGVLVDQAAGRFVTAQSGEIYMIAKGY